MATINLAIAYEMTDDVQSALRWYDGARALANATAEPLDTVVSLQVHVARAKRTACIWDGYEDAEELLLHQVTHEQLGKGQRPGLLPFDTLLLAMDPLLRLAIARFHADEIATATAAMFANAPPIAIAGSSRRARLGVGYVSYDFNDHPTAHLLEGVFTAHDRTTIDAVAFGYGKDDGSEFRQRLVAVVDEFVNLAGVATDACVLEIQARQLDILMDAQGHTRGGRAHITAIRPAPIVVNYLVYPGTSGASYTDYVVADRRVAPPEATASHFSEKLVLLPHSYQVNYYPRAVVPLGRASLWEAGEEEKDGFTFVNFNKIDKLEPAAFSLWMAILRRVPQSRLLLLNPVKEADVDASARRRQDGATTTGDEIVRSLRREAAANGVAPSRIAFVPRVTKRDHLRRHRQGGLFLDTLVVRSRYCTIPPHRERR
jgi:protein O-GlcNAc transferase